MAAAVAAETTALPSTAELDAELARLLLDDNPTVAPPPTDRVAQLEDRIVALERVLGDTLEAFQDLAEQRIERAV